jgi:predicted MPP superfamily phosphohydrolase
MFGKDQRRLIKKIERLNPDIIVITGDLVDSRRYNLNKALKFINSAIDIAPIYYVSGNHEARTRMYTKVKETLEDAGVIILDNTMISINSNIDIIGVPDPDFLDDFFFNSTNTSEIINILEKYCNDEKFQILLAHRPELFSLYSEYNIDLIFSGHAHGGQMRLPFIGGIFAPNQGFFPKFIEGMHVQNKSTMYVSRGLGNSIFPFRIFNKPEIVVVTLKSN